MMRSICFLKKMSRWGQEVLFENAGYPMPTLMQSIVAKIKRDFGEDVNHAIAICYHSGVEGSCGSPAVLHREPP